MRTCEKYSNVLRWAVTEKMIKGMTSTNVERTYGIPSSTALDWLAIRRNQWKA